MNPRRTLGFGIAPGLALSAGASRALAQDTTRIALVVKALGVGFLEAARKGGEEAAQELGNLELI